MKRLVAFSLLFVVLALQTISAQLVSDERRKDALKRYRAGQEHMYAEAWEKARAEFAAAVELDPLLTLAHYGLGQSHMALKQYREAVRAYIGCREAYVKLGSIAGSQSREIDQLREQEIRELRDSLSLLETGRIRTLAGTAMKIQERIKDLERIRGRERGAGNVFPVPSEVHLALGSAYFRSGSLPEAEQEYQEAIRINPKFGEAHNNLAVVYMMTGRYPQAEDEVKAAEKAGFRVNAQFKEDLKKKGSM